MDSVAWFLRNQAERGAGHDVRMTLFESLDLTTPRLGEFWKNSPTAKVSAIGLTPAAMCFRHFAAETRNFKKRERATRAKLPWQDQSPG